jgi:hypothetical protein
MVPHVFDLLSDKKVHEKKIIVVGKGPSSSLIVNRKKQDGEYWIALNDAVTLSDHFDLAHFIDYEPFFRCIDRILDMGSIDVVMPAHPHIREVMEGYHLLELNYTRALNDLKRIWSYDLVTSRNKIYEDKVMIDARTRSSEAIIDILGSCGVSSVEAFGIDGGLQYFGPFEDIPRIKPWEAHDIQFKNLYALEIKHSLHITFNKL